MDLIYNITREPRPTLPRYDYGTRKLIIGTLSLIIRAFDLGVAITCLLTIYEQQLGYLSPKDKQCHQTLTIITVQSYYLLFCSLLVGNWVDIMFLNDTPDAHKLFQICMNIVNISLSIAWMCYADQCKHSSDKIVKMNDWGTIYVTFIHVVPLCILLFSLLIFNCERYAFLQPVTLNLRSPMFIIDANGRIISYHQDISLPPITTFDSSISVECSICLDQVEPQTLIRNLPCKHAFHMKCLDQWLMMSESNNCPLCRAHRVEV